MNSDQVHSGAASVAHSALYLDELKQAALDMRQSMKGQTRGYFTPSEDEQIRQLLISYSHWRAALLELVAEYRDSGGHHDTHLAVELRPAAFLVAYAAVVLLVDAARFLREQFHEMPIVRAKLNEPEPAFGIPAGTYDAVQRSLTRTRHAWHLYHAMCYFEANESLLRRQARQPWLRPAMDVCDRQGHRLQVTFKELARATLRVRTRRVGDRLRYDLLGRALYGMQKLVSSMLADRYVRLRHHPALPAHIRLQLAAQMISGDVLVVRKEYAVTNYLLPGYWPHAALYLGTADQLRGLGLADHDAVRPHWAKQSTDGAVLEAMKDGVRIRSVASPLGSDSMVILRPTLDTGDIARALARGLVHEGKQYDFDFDFTRSDRLVCTEVVYRSYQGIAGIDIPLKRRAGRLTFGGADLLEMAVRGKAFAVHAVYAPRDEANVIQGDAAVRLVERRLHRM